ncbi:nitrate- and nitrite sensing domain-containing protein [Actinoallomurus soli]|uniref:nitrate- and nitrite sensing domain-containing protein n=1 Tax=Actinoallomurus soli TaxID=2952535 RepID=UPI002093CC7C|nr:nitrate- and nitrite sensing domain-containing protein [Actinoallomurus soli]MCO5969669.1 nitrate- and nitrite sensing domain-containing protein [Actinoallomurus soli]
MSLSTLWVFAASITLGDGLNLRHVNTIQDHLNYPSGGLGSALEQERRLAVVFLATKSAGDRASMESGRLVTDRQADLFRRLATDPGAQKDANAQARQWTHEVLVHLDSLQTKRRAIDSGKESRMQAFNDYTDTIADVISLQSSLSTLSDPDVTKDAKNEVALARAREVLSQEDALLAGALATGRLTFSEHVEFTKLVGTQRELYDQIIPDLRPADRAYYQRIVSTPEYTGLQALEDQFTDNMPQQPHAGMAGKAAAKPLAGMDIKWKIKVSSIITRLRGLELSSTASAAERAKPVSDGIIRNVALAGALGLVAVIASLILSLWVGRSVVRDLTGLRRAALDLANERLPSVIRRLRRGDDVDVAAEAPPLSFGTQEIDQVGQAFNAARRTAIQGAVEEAGLRRSISEVFLNLARRNQALLHRQLSLLDSMERRVTEPDELDDLFRLDHLATRMRRHAEGLIILSGQAPGRGWRNPVPVVDVARAAAAEVEDYARVTVAAMPRVAVPGPAVADLIHLLAELIENATLYSPPDTTVQVTGQIVAHGFAFEVEDRGLSMDQASLDRANERLTNPPDFDLSNSAQLGLFVVGRLAQRHQVQVTLRTSPYGGTTAIVLLPDTVVARGDERPELEAGPPATTRRGEEALVPIGAIGGPAPTDGGPITGPITGPIQAIRGDRPPLPQRRSDTGGQATYSTGPYDAKPYGTGSRSQDSTGQDAGAGTGSFPTAGSDTGSFPAAGYEPGTYSTGLGGYDAVPSAYGEEPQETDDNEIGSGYSSGTGGYSPGASSYDSGGTGLGGTRTDTPSGQWPLPGAGSGSDRPPLPTRRGGSSEERPPLPSRFGGAPSPGRSLFDPAEEPADTASPETTASPGATSGSATAGSGTSGTRPALPRRVRQANLAPQLREEVEPVNNATSNERSPEELRTMLSSIQKGWLRGRSDAEQTATHHEEEDI